MIVPIQVRSIAITCALTNEPRMMVLDGNDIMTIRYSNGFSFEGTLLSRTAHSIRVVAKGYDDVREFRSRNGVWISEGCEPVQVEFAYTGKTAAASQIKEDDCICSPEFAAELIQLLFAGENEPPVVPVSEQSQPAGLPFDGVASPVSGVDELPGGHS